MTARRFALAAGVLLAASLLLFQPGYATYDSVAQYAQALSGEYDDWHPPAMARLWSLFGARGTGPMLALQMAAFWAGLGALAAALAAQGRPRGAIAVLLIGVWPPVLGWQAVVLKDTQMLGAMLAAVGLVAWWRLRGRAIPPLAVGPAAVLMTYAVLVRANAVFAVAPLGVMLAMPRNTIARIGAMVTAVVLVLAIMPLVNHRLLGAEDSGVARTEAIYDLAGIAVRSGDAEAAMLSQNDLAVLRARRCVRPMLWDPLGDAGACEAAVAPLHEMAVGTLYRTLAAAVARHPLAYAAHRFAHLNATERWLVPWDWPGAAPPMRDEPNGEGLRTPGAAAAAWQAVAGMMAGWPTSWPVVFMGLGALALTEAARRPPSPPRDLAVALLVSALALEASFTVVSIASDLRYHLWPMVAVPLAAVLLTEGRPKRASIARAAVVLSLLLMPALAARIVLPPAPTTYAGMIAE